MIGEDADTDTDSQVKYEICDQGQSNILSDTRGNLNDGPSIDTAPG